MNNLLLVDMSHLLHKGFHVHQHLSFAGKNTGGLFGFIQQFCNIISGGSFSDILVCLDSPPYSRLDAYPEYKAGRKKNRDPEKSKIIKESHYYILEFLSLIEIPFWECRGLEADDLIAAACVKYTDDYDRIIIASSDDDLYQLFEHDNVFLKKKSGLYGLEDFEEEFPGMDLDDWLYVLAMAGTHNDLPGLKGVGPVAAKKHFTEGTFPKFYKEHKTDIDLFHSLIKLPYEEVKVPRLRVRKVIKERALIMWLAQYGITYTASMNSAVNILNEGD